MEVLYDHQIFSLQQFGGISRYFVELIREFDNCEEITTRLPIFISRNAYLNSLPRFKKNHWLDRLEFKGKSKVATFVNDALTSWNLRSNPPDIIHPTYYHRIPFVPDESRLVISIMDLIDEKFYAGTSRNVDQLIANRKLLCEKADAIISISECTKRDIVDILGVSPEKVHVIHLAGSEEIRSNLESQRQRTHSNYLLFVGSRSRYKNFATMLEAFSRIHKKWPDQILICAGGGPFTKEEIETIARLGVGSKVRQVPVNDSALMDLYSGASCFVFPSHYEGFGIPVLEAFACSCPTIVANAGSLPEIAGNGALLFDPDNVGELAERLSELLSDQNLRGEIVSKASQRLANFSWKKCASKTFALYNKVLQ